MSAHSATVLGEILRERARQDAKWGPQDHPSGTGLPGDRYEADLARQVCDEAAKSGRQCWRLIAMEEFREALAEPEGPELRRELIQTAAVLVHWIECIDQRRRRGAEPNSKTHSTVGPEGCRPPEGPPCGVASDLARRDCRSPGGAVDSPGIHPPERQP